MLCARTAILEEMVLSLESARTLFARFAGTLGVALAAHADASCASCAPVECPVLDVGLEVTPADGSGAITGVQVTFTGPDGSAGTLNCDNYDGTTACNWSGVSGKVTDSDYELTVTAPGYQTATVSADVMFTPAPANGCGCATGKVTPSDVVLTPM